MPSSLPLISSSLFLLCHSQVGDNLRQLANTHQQVMVLFCDVVGFTAMSKEVQAQEVRERECVCEGGRRAI
jgi:class 3 adenylate cyclase